MDDEYKPISTKRMGIWSLDDDDLSLSRSIVIDMENYGEYDIVAKYEDDFQVLTAVGYGDTDDEALFYLKKDLCYIYRELTRDEKNLGPMNMIKLQILRKFIRERYGFRN